MNFLDAYDLTTPTAPAGQQPETSLNEEVSQVVGQLSRFWGGFRKQSQDMIAAARKDLGEAVTQAQKEFSKLTAEAPAPAPDASTSFTATEGEQSTEDITTSTASIDSQSTIDPEKTPTPSDVPSSSSPQLQPTLLSRLQASLPPQLVSSVSEKLPDSIKHARNVSLSAPDFAALRNTLVTELQRVQGTSEELLHRAQTQGGEFLQQNEGLKELRARGEGLLQKVQGGGEELLREAGEFLKEAVKVVPPEEGANRNVGVAWDGTDVWMIPTYTVSPSTEESSSTSRDKGKGKEKERRSIDSVRAATRAEALLTQLRYDPQVIRADPATGDAATVDAYVAWIESEVEAKGGMEGETWKARTEKELQDRKEVVVLMEGVVPTDMDALTFWTRYFFRVHQVEREEERRKALLQGTVESEEDFSWEDDEEEAPSPTAPKPTSAPSAPVTPATARPLQPAPDTGTPALSTPSNVSPRQSSEGSYDVVSAQASRGGSANASAKEDEDDEGEDEDEDDEEEEESGEDDEEESEEESGEEEEGEANAKPEAKKTGEEASEEDSDWE